MKAKPFEQIRDGLVTSMLTLLGKYYGEDLDIGQGVELSSALAYKVDSAVRKHVREAEEHEKNTVAARTQNL